MCDMGNILNMIAAFRNTYPNYNPPDVKETAKILLMTLGDIPADTLQSAILTCITETGRQFAPSVGEIRGAALRINAQAAGIPDANTAYAEVANMPANMTRIELIRENGENVILQHTLKWSHAFVEHVAGMIGWPNTFPTGEPGVDRAQFVKWYDAQLVAKMSEAGRLPAVTEYIERKRGEFAGTMPAFAEVAKRLEAK